MGFRAVVREESWAGVLVGESFSRTVCETAPPLRERRSKALIFEDAGGGRETRKVEGDVIGRVVWVGAEVEGSARAFWVLKQQIGLPLGNLAHFSPILSFTSLVSRVLNPCIALYLPYLPSSSVTQ